MKTTAVHPSTTPTARGGKGAREPSDAARRNFLVFAANMSWQLAIVVIGPIVLGTWLDKHFATGNLWVFVGLAVALVAATAVVWRTVQLANRLPVPKLTAAQKRAVQKRYKEEDDDE